MGRAGSRSSPSGVIRRVAHLSRKRRRDALKPPYTCPICCTKEAVGLFEYVKIPDPDPENRGHGTSVFTFSCRKGCFNRTVKLDSLNCEPVDGYNKIVDELYQEQTQEKELVCKQTGDK